MSGFLEVSHVAIALQFQQGSLMASLHILKATAGGTYLLTCSGTDSTNISFTRCPVKMHTGTAKWIYDITCW